MNTPSPNGHSARRATDYIVVHAMAEFVDDGKQVQHALDFLATHDRSAHRLVTPTGEVLTTRTDDQGAWHCKGYNLRSLGIEILVPSVHTWATFCEAIKEPWATQDAINATASQVAQWLTRWPDAQVVQHFDLNDRKPDPGSGFPWPQFEEMIRWRLCSS